MTFLERMWAYITLGAMGLVWEEASPLLGGLAAYDRNLHPLSVVVAVALGTWIAGVGVYFLGRWRGRWLRKRWPKARTVILRSVAIVRRHPWRSTLASRFAYGLRIPVLLACGVGRVPFRLYAAGTAVSCIAWSLAFTLMGWGLGRTTETLLGQVKRFELVFGVALLLLMLLGYLVLRRRHVADRTAEVLDRDR